MEGEGIYEVVADQQVVYSHSLKYSKVFNEHLLMLQEGAVLPVVPVLHQLARWIQVVNYRVRVPIKPCRVHSYFEVFVSLLKALNSKWSCREPCFN